MAHADSPPLSLVKEKNTDNFRSSSAAAPPRRRFRDGAADKAAGRRFWFLLQIKIVLPTGIGEDEDEGKRRGIYTSNCVNLQNKSLGDSTKRCGKSRQNTSIVDETIVHARNKTTKTNPQRKKLHIQPSVCSIQQKKNPLAKTDADQVNVGWAKIKTVICKIWHCLI